MEMMNQDSLKLNPPGEPCFNEMLILNVRNYPPLYSNQRRSFDNADRNQIWAEIAKKIGRGSTAEFAKKRWLQLRDRYRKELKIAISQSFAKPQKWNHFRMLTWLDPFLQGSLTKNISNGSDISCDQDFASEENNYLDKIAKYASQSHDDCNLSYDSCDQETYDDPKPVSPLRSILAATEASVHASIRDPFSFCSYGKKETDERTPEEVGLNVQSLILSGSERLLISASPVQAVDSPGHSSELNGAACDDYSATSTPSCSSPRDEPNSTNISGTRYAFHPYARKKRSRNSRLSKKIHQKIQDSYFPPEQSLPCWTDDEEMLFARIVALRLKEFSKPRRREVQQKIMSILDRPANPNGEKDSRNELFG